MASRHLCAMYGAEYSARVNLSYDIKTITLSLFRAVENISQT